MQHDAALGKKMSAHRTTHEYLEVIAENANQSVQSLRPDDTWAGLGISDDDTMRRIAMQLQIVLGEVIGAKDVAGGLILTWKAAALGTLTREQATAEIQDAQSEHAEAVAKRARTEEVVVTAAKRKKTAKKKRKKKVAKKKAAKQKGGRKKGGKKKGAKKPKSKRGARRARPSKKK
jgi:hypothetical protein